jgi:hypothetical protein
MINLKEEFRDEQQFATEIRLRVQMLAIILLDIEEQRQLLHHLQQGKCMSGSAFEKLLDLMNRAEYYTQELEKRIQKSL